MLSSLDGLEQVNGTVHNPFTFTIKVNSTSQAAKLSKALGIEHNTLDAPSRFEFYTQWWSSDPHAAEKAALQEFRNEKVSLKGLKKRKLKGGNEYDSSDNEEQIATKYRWHCIVEYSANDSDLVTIQDSKKNRPRVIPGLVVLRRHRDSTVKVSRDSKPEPGCFELNNKIWRFEFSAPVQDCEEENMNEAYRKSYLIGHICAIAYFDTRNSTKIGETIWNTIAKAYNSKISRSQGFNAALINETYHPWNWGHLLDRTLRLEEWQTMWKNAMKQGTNFPDSRTLTRTIFARTDASHSRLFKQWAKCARRGVNYTRAEQVPRVRKVRPWDYDLCEFLFGRTPEEPLGLDVVKRCPEQLSDSEYQVMKRLSSSPQHNNLYNTICQAAGVPLNMDSACLYWVGQKLLKESIADTVTSSNISGAQFLRRGDSSDSFGDVSKATTTNVLGTSDRDNSDLSGGPQEIRPAGPLSHLHPYLTMLMLSTCLTHADRTKLSKNFEDDLAKRRTKEALQRKFRRIAVAVDALIAAVGKAVPEKHLRDEMAVTEDSHLAVRENNSSGDLASSSLQKTSSSESTRTTRKYDECLGPDPVGAQPLEREPIGVHGLTGAETNYMYGSEAAMLPGEHEKRVRSRESGEEAALPQGKRARH